jgi:ribosomal-protein-alanine N-acetyltransferase
MRVTLHQATLADRDEFLTASRASAALHRGWVTPLTTADDVAEMFAKGERENACLLLVRRRDDGSLAGWFMISEVVRGAFQCGFLGYAGFAGATGEGLMADGLELVLRHAFGPLRLHRLEANIQPLNAPSIALVRRAGFRQEGFSPRYLKVAGRWRDHERWAITREDRR